MGVIYTLSFIATMVLLVIFLARYRTRISVYYCLFFISIVVSNMGYMQLAYSNNLESALFANQVVYLGGCFCPFFMLMCVADLCKVKVKLFFQVFMIIYTSFLFALVSSVGTVTLYYKEISFVKENGVGRLIKEYGPLHKLFPMYILFVCAVALFYIVDAFRRRRDVSYVTSTMLVINMTTTAVTYIGEKVFKLSVELVPLAFIFTAVCTLFLLRRISMYEVTVITANSMVESLAYGFFICDSKGLYLGSDEAAKIWFPEIRELPIDFKIKEENTDFLVQVGKWMRNEDDREIAYIEKDDCIYEARHSIIKECKTHNVHCIYLRDDTKQQKYTKLVKQYNEDLEADVEKKTEKLRKIQNDILISMASIVENRDSNTGGHIARTSDIVRIFVDYLSKNKDFPELTEHMAASIVKAAPLHDFGKIAIPDLVLNKPGKFTEDEYEQMKQHSAKGAVIVESILHHSEDRRFRQIAVNVAHYHHEKWNGSGYPEGLSGLDIPFEARVMALADVFDALVSKRVYKESFGYDKAFGIIEESCGTHFDPELCKAFLECRPQLEELYDSYTD